MKNNWKWGLVAMIVVLAGLVVGLILVRQPQKTETEAAIPSGSATFRLDPASPTIWTGDSFTVSGQLNTGSISAIGYQVIATLSYTTDTSPVNISATSVTTTEPALNCVSNSLIHDSVNKRYNLVVSCASSPNSNPPPPFVPYSTSNQFKTVFSFDVEGISSGQLTYTFDVNNSFVTDATDASDVLTFPASGSITVQEDITGPAAVSDLAAINPTLDTINLTWTDPADSGPSTSVASHEIRMSTANITNANWSSAGVVTGIPAPSSPGTSHNFQVTGLQPNTTYFFAYRSTDSVGNVSDLSNVASATTLNTGRLDFSLRFQGVTGNVTGKMIRVELKQGSTSKYTFASVPLTATGGVYSGSRDNIDGGTYDVYLKGPSHLQKKITGVSISTANNTQGWPTTAPTMLAGDINNDNKVDLLDYSAMVLKYLPGVIQTDVSDLNFDNKVDLLDYSLLILNYNPGTTGD